MDFFKSLDTFLGPQLTTLVSLVAEQCSKHVSFAVESCPKYLYFNKLNLAYKSTIHLDNRRCSNVLTTPEVLRIITDINNDTKRCVKLGSTWSNNYNVLYNYRLKETGEIVIKTMSEYWVVGKLSNLREFFVVIQQKNASLIEIDGRYKKNWHFQFSKYLIESLYGIFRWSKKTLWSTVEKHLFPLV